MWKVWFQSWIPEEIMQQMIILDKRDKDSETEKNKLITFENRAQLSPKAHLNVKHNAQFWFGAQFYLKGGLHDAFWQFYFVL